MLDLRNYQDKRGSGLATQLKAAYQAVGAKGKKGEERRKAEGHKNLLHTLVSISIFIIHRMTTLLSGMDGGLADAQ